MYKIIPAIMLIFFNSLVTVAAVDAADYTIYLRGNTYFARNGATGRDEFSNDDAGKAINDSIRAISGTGGSIALASGVFDVSTTIRLRSNIGIYGRRGAVLKPWHLGHLIEGAGVEGVVLDGFEIDGNRSHYPRFALDPADIVRAPEDAISEDIAEKVLEASKSEPNDYGFGIFLVEGSSNNLISNLYIRDCRRDGIILVTSPENRITGNRVENCDGGGIALCRSNYIVASENEVYRTHYHGIIVTQGANCQVVNNRIVEAGYYCLPGEFCHGIAVDSNGGSEPWGYNNLISGNIIIDPNMAGIEVADKQDFCVISNNIVENPHSYGIYFGGGIAASSNATIVGNIVKGAADSGIRVSSPYGHEAVSAHVAIANNVVSDSTRHGIQLDTVGHVSLSANVCLNNRGNGIFIAGESEKLNAYRISIIGNDSYDSRDRKVQQYGIYLKNANHVTVIGNSLGPNKVGGIYRENVSSLLEKENR